MVTLKLVGKKRFAKELKRAQDLLQENGERPEKYSFSPTLAEFQARKVDGSVVRLYHDLIKNQFWVTEGDEVVGYGRYPKPRKRNLENTL